jgi:hypothetical protein
MLISGYEKKEFAKEPSHPTQHVLPHSDYALELGNERARRVPRKAEGILALCISVCSFTCNGVSPCGSDWPLVTGVAFCS